MEHIINNHILPENENDAERAGRLVTIVASLDEKQKLAFTALMRKQQSTNENIHRFVTLCQDLVSITFMRFCQHQYSIHLLF